MLAALPAVGQDSLRTVPAVAGDGIYSLLRNNGYSPSRHYNAFIKENKDLLTDGELLKVGVVYKLPDTTMATKAKVYGTFDTAIFGEDFASIDSLSTTLKGSVYYLVSGHGGPDPGATETYKGKLIAEDEYAYDITLRLARELLSHGAEVYLIIQDKNDGIRDAKVLDLDSDEVAYPNKTIPLGHLARLKQRTKAINTLYKKHLGKYQRLIVTHVDSRSEGTNIDVFFYYHEKSKSGKRLAESIRNTFTKKYARFQPNRGYQGTFGPRNLYLIRKTLPPMAYIEVGNIKNKKDQRRILDPDNRQALAKWISEGILLDFEKRNRTNTP